MVKPKTFTCNRVGSTSPTKSKKLVIATTLVVKAAVGGSDNVFEKLYTVKINTLLRNRFTWLGYRVGLTHAVVYNVCPS